MRAALALLVLAACETTPVVTNALDGGVACGAMQCADNELCVDYMIGFDAGGGGGGSLSCFAVPKGCYVFNCSGVHCAPCLRELCGAGGIQVAGRNVDCPAQ